MKENIALIQEVHHKKPRLKAEEEATMLLEKIGLKHIANNRSNQCSKIEIIYVMIIRALMMDQNEIILKLPFALADTMLDISMLINNIEILNADINKKITILDNINNFSHYEGCRCNIIK
jgi:ABC-type lipopolysaccharide export system ATPase subunit